MSDTIERLRRQMAKHQIHEETGRIDFITAPEALFES